MANDNRLWGGLCVIAAIVLLFLFASSARSRRPRTANESDARKNSERTVPDVHFPAAASGLESFPLEKRTAGDGTLFMRLAASETQIDFTNRLDDHAIWSGDFRQVLNGSIGTGTCVGDFDNDGRVDIYLAGRDCPNKLYRQVGDFRFEDVTDKAGVGGGTGISAGATCADVDNDGDLDLYLCKYDDPNALYINQGDGTFIESAAAHGLDFEGCSVMAAVSDYDRDGDLDLYLLTNRLFISDARTQRAIREIQSNSGAGGRPVVPANLEEFMYFSEQHDASGRTKYVAVPAGQRDHLFRNDGNGHFRDVTAQVGIRGCYRGHSATWCDLNRDGWPDLYVANDFFDPDQLYRNNGDGTFTDITKDALPHTPWYSMGCDAADINNDGWFDLLASDMSATTHFKHILTMGSMSEQRWFLESAEPRQYMRNALYLNTATERFMEVAYLAGLDSSDWTWSAKFRDMDNDGWIDVFFTNGMIRNTMDSDLRQQGSALGAQSNSTTMAAVMRASEPLLEANIARRNKGDLQFEDAGQRWGLADVGISCSAAFADLDRDGDQDLVVNHYNQPAGIYRNQDTAGHSVRIRLRGTKSNSFGIGAVARIETSSGLQVRQMTLSSGYMSSDEPVLHFGLGPVEAIAKLTIYWPSGHVQGFESLPADRCYVITEPDSPPPSARQHETETMPLFRDASSDVSPSFTHHERGFDDFVAQPLLPYRLSRLGAGLAWGDADGDGNEDLFLAGAAGMSGRLYITRNDGKSLVRKSGPWDDDQDYEDMTPLWLDADQDDDLDLFVSSGSVECEPGDRLLQSRLYINNGKAEFRRAGSGTLPDIRQSSSVACAADFDLDGDLDLFVGGRVIPGKYPLSPGSVLLRNDGGSFVDVTNDLAPGLRDVGMVTGALWSDAMGDRHPELLLAIEWGPVHVFQNIAGQLVDHTGESGLADHLGWWNGITGGDLDGDADIDYVVTNVGQNTKYEASRERPAQLYYGDLDGTGKPQLVEAAFEEEQLFPIRGRSCSTSAMPSLARRFPSFRSFAAANLDELYSRARLDAALRLEANCFDSVVLFNLGDGRFAVRPLPRFVQAAPGFGVAISDFDGDGANDIYVVQNFFSPQSETGRMDGGVSVLLRGDGAGGLMPLQPSTSGLIVPGDAKGLGIADPDQDGWPDIAISQNDQPMKLFRHTGSARGSSCAIRLQGTRGNRSAVGARVTVHHSDGTRQSAEVYAGSGYLSQSSPLLFFGRRSKDETLSIEIDWPDGQKSTHVIEPGEVYVNVPYVVSR